MTLNKDTPDTPAGVSVTTVTSVTNKCILDEVYDFVNRFVYLPNEHYKTVITLWIAHTHFIDTFYWSPKLMIVSPERRSGKSRLVEIAELMAQNPITTFNATPQALWRMINREVRPTILYDETDRLFSKKTQDNLDMIGLINASSKRGAKVYRCDPNNPSDVVELNAFAPIMLAGIAVSMPDTITDRSILLNMERHTKKHRAEPYRPRHWEAAGKDIGRRLAEWSHSQVGERTKVIETTDEFGKTKTFEIPYTRQHSAEDSTPKMPEGLIDRLADNWEPLFIVTDVTDVTEWRRRVWDAALFFMSENKDNDEPSLGIQLLTHIRHIIKNWDMSRSQFHIDTGNIPSICLVGLLHEMEDSPWNGEDFIPRLTQRNLAHRLKRFKVKAKTVRVNYEHYNGKIESRTIKGYSIADLQVAFNKWLEDEEDLVPPPPTGGVSIRSPSTPSTVSTQREETKRLEKTKPKDWTPSDDVWKQWIDEFDPDPIEYPYLYSLKHKETK